MHTETYTTDYITVAAKTNNRGNNNINDNIIITGDSKKNNLLVKGGGGRNVLFNYTLNTFYLRLYGVGHMVKDHSDSERGNPLLPHRLLFPISSMGSFICIIPQTG